MPGLVQNLRSVSKHSTYSLGWLPVSRPHLRLWLVLSSTLMAVVLSCQGDASRAQSVVNRSIERYGGDRFQNVHIRFTFRGIPFEVIRRDGRYRYQRTVSPPGDSNRTEVMENSGSWMEVDGTRVDLDPQEIYDLETAVNSVVYFGFLPFRLDDPSVVLRDLGSAVVRGEPYDKIEVTFEQEGGGVDWDARFVYWIHERDSTVDYLAYQYSRDGGGARFRRAVNRREVGGLTIQDYENYGSDPDVSDIAEFDQSFQAGRLELLSMVELEQVEVGS